MKLMQHLVLLLLLLLLLQEEQEGETSKIFGLFLLGSWETLSGMCRLAEEEQEECLMPKQECQEAI